MILAAECVLLCLLFTLLVYVMSREPIKTLYNYPPAIQARVRTLEAYKDRVPTRKNKLAAKCAAVLLFVLLLSLLLRYVNGCTAFVPAFLTGFGLWTAVNLWDLLVLDILWFCHDPRFVFEGTEDMTDAYHDYGFHFRGFLIGEALALAVCAAAALAVGYLP